jgi:hypothetical protein
MRRKRPEIALTALTRFNIFWRLFSRATSRLPIYLEVILTLIQSSSL